MSIGTTTMENSTEILWKTKNRATIWPCNPTPGYITKGKHGSKGYIQPNIHCSTVSKSQDRKQPKCPSKEELIKMWCVCTYIYIYIHTMEFNWVIKKNEIMLFAATWLDLEISILKEVRQRSRNIMWYPLHEESKKTWYKWTYLQNRNWLTDLENELMVVGGRDS